MENPFLSIRRMLQTTGAIYYGTASFDYPINIYASAPVPALPPGTSIVVGYDFTCLMKDIRRTNCDGMTISVWSIMASLCVITGVFCLVLIPIACIYRSGRSAGSNLKKMWNGGDKNNPYAEMEKRAAKNSKDMPLPPKVSQYRPSYNRPQDVEDEDWE